MRVVDGLQGLAALVGQELGVSGWLRIDQDRIQQFADATGDHQWIHVDPVRAAAGPYGRTIAHGYLTLSLLPLLSGEVYRVDGLKMTMIYGLDKVRFPAPVPMGSRLRNRPVLVSLTDTRAGTQALIRHTLELEGSGRPACVADQIRLMVP
ncbi:MAG TPA: MaoC family dehydratase [Arthrobacter sp.]|nr:MaoC family dehydratase [Arthrobacter sp.]